jgi:hypothetical protein
MCASFIALPPLDELDARIPVVAENQVLSGSACANAKPHIGGPNQHQYIVPDQDF